MEALSIAIAALAAAAWIVFALSPRGYWRNREVLDAAQPDEGGVPAEITALIPARNEAAVIRETLRALIAQGCGLKIIVIDDASDDGTAEAARQASTEVRSEEHTSELQSRF